jgi:hypothetical protein
MLQKLFRGNIYTDLIWLFVGIAGGIYFYSNGSYWATGVFTFLAILYLVKILRPRIRNNEMS